MRLIRFSWIAAVSAVLAVSAERPRYGGELRMETRAVLRNLDLAATTTDPEAATRNLILSQVFETLVKFDGSGLIVPNLASSWTHDVSHNRWLFHLKSAPMGHDGATWETPFPMPGQRSPLRVLRDAANPSAALIRKNTDDTLAGTGPFRIAEFEPGKRLRLVAHENYWGGRPYLDAIEIRMGRTLREQATDFDAGLADIIEIPISDIRRTRSIAGHNTFTAPMETIALVFDANKVPPNAREAVALTLDRASMHSVLLQKQGEPTAALIPQWISGYAFTFTSTRDLIKARKLQQTTAIEFAFERQDPLLRSIAERITLNASEAGIKLSTAAGQSADLRLVRLALPCADPYESIRQLAALFRAPSNGDAYNIEKELLDGFRIIPLFHLPVIYHASQKVRGWQSTQLKARQWNLADVWLSGARRP